MAWLGKEIGWQVKKKKTVTTGQKSKARQLSTKRKFLEDHHPPGKKKATNYREALFLAFYSKESL